MNEATPARWLVLSYFANIDGMAPSQHLDDRLPHLRRLGIDPVLLTGPCCEAYPGLTHVRVPSSAPSGWRFELRHLRRRANAAIRLGASIASTALLPVYLLEKLAADLDSQWSWYPLAARKGIALCREQSPSLIYSTGGPWSAHVAAARIARATGLPWIAELQDPLVHRDWQRSQKALRISARVERTIFGEASAVVFLTEAAARAAEARTGIPGKAHAILPGAEPLPPGGEPYRKGTHCRFAHFGSLGRSRNLKVFLSALEIAFKRNHSLAETIRLDVFGSIDRLSRDIVRMFPQGDVVTLHGRVPRSRSLEAMRGADVLLLIQNTEDFSVETIPSKTYEYLHTGRPVLGLVFRNPELSAILEDSGHRSAGADSPEEVAAAVEDIHERWESGDLGTREAVSPYTVSSAVDALVALSRSRNGRA